MYTEEEAYREFCFQTWDKETRQFLGNCIASDCMAWRWKYAHCCPACWVGYGNRFDKSPCCGVPTVQRGYCGLAGPAKG